MSNASLELGGDNWAAKDGNLLGYAVGDSSGKYVPREFTFTRGSNLAATRVAANGLIEKGRENLLLNSVWDGVTTNVRPTGWASQLRTGTGTFDATATEGQIRFQTLDASSRSFIYSPVVDTNGIVVVSVYVDEVNTTLPLSNMLSRSANATFLFAYEDGVEINYSDNVQAGKRYSVVLNKTASTTFRIGVGTGNDVLGDVVLSRPQVEVGLVATEWITSPVGSTGLAGLLEDEPRIDYTGGTGSLLLEPSRTNLIPQSEYFGDWNEIQNATTELASVISPEGKLNAYEFTFDGTSNGRIEDSISVTSGNTYTFSVYLKNKNISTPTQIWIGFSAPTNQGEYVTVTDEWQRFETTQVADGSTEYPRILCNGVGAIYAFGAQVEEGSYATSYIPNHSGGSVTRGGDSAITIPSAAFEWDGLASGDSATLFIETKVTAVLNNNFNILSQGGSGVWKWNSTSFFARTNNPATAPSFSMGVDINTLEGSTIKIAFVKDDGNLKMFYNGNSIGVVAIGTAELDWCSHISSNYQSAQGLKQFAGFNTALSDAQCSALTVEGLKEEILTSYIAAVDTLEDGAEARLDTYLQNLEELIV